MSITEKINDYLIKKMAKSKCQYLFAVSKEYLFTKVHELSEEVEQLRDKNLDLNKIIHGLQIQDNNILVHCDDLQKENNTLKSQIEAHTNFDYERAYKGLTKEFEDLQKENKSIKKTLDVVSGVIEKTESQNNKLKEQCKILSTQNLRLAAENKKSKENVIENKVVKHNFTKKVNTNSVSLSK